MSREKEEEEAADDRMCYYNSIPNITNFVVLADSSGNITYNSTVEGCATLYAYSFSCLSVLLSIGTLRVSRGTLLSTYRVDHREQASIVALP